MHNMSGANVLVFPGRLTKNKRKKEKTYLVFPSWAGQSQLYILVHYDFS